jgi:signal transduction histidine kinase
VFEVADTGIGLSGAQMKDLFKPFEQVDSSTTRPFGGSGLGLAITRRLCDLMNGSVAVVSEPGKGSRFTVRIPTVGDADAAPDPAAPVPAPTARLHADASL